MNTEILAFCLYIIAASGNVIAEFIPPVRTSSGRWVVRIPSASGVLQTKKIVSLQKYYIMNDEKIPAGVLPAVRLVLDITLGMLCALCGFGMWALGGSAVYGAGLLVAATAALEALVIYSLIYGNDFDYATSAAALVSAGLAFLVAGFLCVFWWPDPFGLAALVMLSCFDVAFFAGSCVCYQRGIHGVRP